MGNWNINIQGIGSHHNGKPESDADLAALEFVAKLRSMGHTIEFASFTYGGKVDLIESNLQKVKVIINGKEQEIVSLTSYEEVIKAAGFPEKSQPTVIYSIPCDTHFVDGSLLPGKKLKVVNKTRFEVADTSNA